MQYQLFPRVDVGVGLPMLALRACPKVVPAYQKGVRLWVAVGKIEFEGV